jgi:phage shock protein A
MRLADRVSGLRTARINHLLAQHETSDADLGELALRMERAAFELRREAVTAVAQRQRLREEAFTARQMAAAVERRAARALERGEEILARQILARDICTLKSRDALETELSETSRSVAGLLDRLVRTEDEARLVRRFQKQLGKGGRGC